MIAQLLALFGIQQKGKKPSVASEPKHVSPGTRTPVDPKRIGDIGEYKVNLQLSQFPASYRSQSDLLLPNPRSKTGYAQIDHVLLTPHAVFVIETKNYEGSIRGKKDDRYWRVNAKFSMYNPVKQNETHIRVLKRHLPGYDAVPYISIVSFTMRCKLQIEEEIRRIESDVLVVYDVRLTDYIERKIARFAQLQAKPPLSDADINEMYVTIAGANVVDAKIRAQHNEKAGDS